MLEILTSPVLPRDGFVHGFPTRAGGVSQGKRSSLNLGYRWGDEPDKVAENRRIVAAGAGYDPERLRTMRHVHGTDVWIVGDPAPASGEFDILVTAAPGDTLGAFAADCIPLLFIDPVKRVVAAAHAGWRGTVAGASAIAVRAMRDRFGSRPADVRVALGPSIGPCCFEVGPEVVEAFKQALPDVDVTVTGPRKEHIDLHKATRAILEREGVAGEHIDDRPPCTRCDEQQRFFSFRRDGREGGIHMGFVGIVEG